MERHLATRMQQVVMVNRRGGGIAKAFRIARATQAHFGKSKTSVNYGLLRAKGKIR